MKAVELQGTVDSEGHLVLKENVKLRIEGPVRVILLAPEEDEDDEIAWIKAASKNEAFDFLNDDGEDIYSQNDGNPFLS